MEDTLTRCFVTGKITYETRGEAEQRMRRDANYGKQGPPRGAMRVYRCPHCATLHWGHTGGRKKPF